MKILLSEINCIPPMIPVNISYAKGPTMKINASSKRICGIFNNEWRTQQESVDVVVGIGLLKEQDVGIERLISTFIS